MTNLPRPRVLVLGAGDDTGIWAQALCEHSDVVHEREASWAGIDGLVLGRGAPDPFAQAREALLARVPVLYAAPFVLNPWQTRRLAELSRSQNATLRYADAAEPAPVSFLRRMLSGSDPIWQPLYIRQLRLEEQGAGRMDQLAIEELALSDALLGRAPESIEATAARSHDSTEVLALFITGHYAGGLTVQCTLSLSEGRQEHRLVAVTNGRTIALDRLNSTPSLRMSGPDAEEQTYEAAAAGEQVDAIACEARRFVETIRGGASESNADRWCRIAAAWWAVRQSMSFGGRVELPRLAETGPPPLQVIKGGGKTSRAGKRPALALVAS